MDKDDIANSLIWLMILLVIAIILCGGLKLIGISNESVMIIMFQYGIVAGLWMIAVNRP